MHQPIHKRPWVRRTSFLLLFLLLGYGTYRAVRPDPKLKKVKQLQAEFAASAKDWTPEQRREKGQEMRAAMEQLSPAQRDVLSAERQKRTEDELKHYAQMSPTEKTRHLDEQIDRMEKMRQQFAQRNPNAGGNPAGQRPQTGGPGTFGSGRPGGGGPQSQTPEQREKRRKERLDKSTPEFRALTDMYRKDMENRRKQRGLITR